jgi:hypothetical protein
MDTATELAMQIGILISAWTHNQQAPTEETARYLEQCYEAVAHAIENAVIAGACRIK